MKPGAFRTTVCLLLGPALLAGCAARQAPQVVAAPEPADAASASGARLAVHREYASTTRSTPLMLLAGPTAGTPRASGGPRASGAPGTSAGDKPVARLPGLVITQKQLVGPLVEAHGLTVLLNVVQLELARQHAQRKGVTLSPDDVDRERDRMLEQAFGEADAKTRDQIEAAVAKGDNATADRLRAELKKDRERALEQLLVQQKAALPVFEMVLRTNAYLRKIAEQDMKEIPDDVVRKAFEVEYGATVRVRHIQAITRQDLLTVQERLKKGEPFELLAKQHSRNPRTGPLGGELPRFSLATTNIPQVFKEVAFSLEEGQVSNVVECDGAYHLIKLDKKFPPRAVKFETERDRLRQKVREQYLANTVEDLREQLAEQTRNHLKIEDPVLASQYAKRMDEAKRQIQDMDKIREQQARERQARQQQQGGGAAPVDPSSVLPVPVPAPQAPAKGPAQQPPAPPGAQ